MTLGNERHAPCTEELGQALGRALSAFRILRGLGSGASILSGDDAQHGIAQAIEEIAAINAELIENGFLDATLFPRQQHKIEN